MHCWLCSDGQPLDNVVSLDDRLSGWFPGLAPGCHTVSPVTTVWRSVESVASTHSQIWKPFMPYLAISDGWFLRYHCSILW